MEEEGVDERTLKPDFYVDRPPTPEFIPNPAGVDEETQIDDRELFDFELEAEPVLEVLVGKALEAARIEALEDWEREELRQHKARYEREREAELLEVQRVEAVYNRRQEETQRRQRQQEAQRTVLKQTQKKLLSRLISRGVLGDLRGASIQHLVDTGVLRDPKEQDLHAKYVPHLYGVVEEQVRERQDESAIFKGNEAAYDV